MILFGGDISGGIPIQFTSTLSPSKVWFYSAGELDPTIKILMTAISLFLFTALPATAYR